LPAMHISSETQAFHWLVFSDWHYRQKYIFSFIIFWIYLYIYSIYTETGFFMLLWINTVSHHISHRLGICISLSFSRHERE
jgi:hypothetical protein